MRVGGILETALYVADLSRSADFYRRLFDFGTLLESGRLIALDAAGRNVLLLFLESATTESCVVPGGVIPPHGGSGHLHLAFSIAAGDVEPWERRLEDGVDPELRQEATKLLRHSGLSDFPGRLGEVGGIAPDQDPDGAGIGLS